MRPFLTALAFFLPNRGGYLASACSEDLKPIVAVSPGGYFPVLVQGEGGELFAVVRGGAPHVGVGGRVDLIRSSDGGHTWSKPLPVATEPPDSRNPAFGVARGGRLVVSYSVTGPYPDGKFDSHVSGQYSSWVRISDDRGKNWSQPQRLDTAPYPYSSPYGKIVSLFDGTLLLPIYTWYLPEKPGGPLASEQKGDFACFMRSSDGGKTWSPPELIARGHNETSLVVLPRDELLAVMRDMAGGLSQSRSRDKGRMWSASRPLLTPGQHPADVIRLASGRLLAVFGHRKPPLGVQAIWSDDGGETWSLPRRAVLEGKSVNTDCGYPSSVQLADGTIVTMYYGVAHRVRTELNQYAMVVRYREGDLAGLAVSEEAGKE